MLAFKSYEDGLVRLLSAIEYDANCLATDEERLSSIRLSVKNYKHELKVLKKKKVEKELTTEIVEYLVGIKAVIRRHECSMNKDMAFVYKTSLNVSYDLLKLEGYSDDLLRMVIYNEHFEYKGITY